MLPSSLSFQEKNGDDVPVVEIDNIADMGRAFIKLKALTHDLTA